jgi:hypothetical protein
MTSDVTNAPGGDPPRTRWQRWRRVILPAAAALLAFGAFLMWGPIGLGNGPLAVQMGSSNGWTDAGQMPAAFILPIYNSGGRPAVIDSVDLVGSTRYPIPRLLHLEVVSVTDCAGAWPARTDGHGFTLVDCADARDQGPLIGRTIRPNTPPDSRGFLAAAITTAPPPGACWVIGKIILRYHVGIRHYVVADPYELAVCGRGAEAQVTPAMTTAEGVE